MPSIITGNFGTKQGNGLTAADIQNVVAAIAPIFRANVDQLAFKNAQVDGQGDEHFRFTQQKNGRAVMGGDLTVHVRNGVAYSANGTVRDDLDAPTTAKISADRAIEVAKAQYPTITDLAATAKEGDLLYLRGVDRLDLVYNVTVTGTKADQTPVNDSVYVNASDGRVLLSVPHVYTAKNRELHDTANTQTLPGPLVRVEGGDPAPDVVINNNYDRLGTTWDAYKELYGRDSFDNNGAKLISTIHYGVQYVNAFWNSTQMVYGDGDGVNASNLANSLDVTAHELTHAVTEKTSNLTYSGESGGLNESMSDIFGNVVEWYRDGKVVSANTWKVGEDIWTPNTPDDALRYMDDPAKDGDSLDWYPDYASGVDVHYSSGISNLAFYLLSQGGKHPRNKSQLVVTGIGFEKAAAVFYRANTTLFQPSTTFEQAKAYAVQAATELGLSTDEVASVDNAWKAVGVGIPEEEPPSTLLTNGVPVEHISGASQSQTFYRLEVPAGQNLTITISGEASTSGDADLYTKFGIWPKSGRYDCRPYKTGNNEECKVEGTQAGVYWIRIHGYSAYTGVKLVAKYEAPPPPGRLVINEVEYDEVGSTDRQEFIEILNVGGLPVNLADHKLYLVDGEGSTGDTLYSIVDLSTAGTLNPGQYLVVGDADVTVPAGAKKITFYGLYNQIENGSPDGVAIATSTTLVDAVSYGGLITTAPLAFGNVSLVEGARTTAKDSNTVVRSLSRLPNGTDTNNAASDWKATPNVTPGTANN